MRLDPLLRPRSIAVIGASGVPSRIGGMAIDLCLRGGFTRIYPVNPKRETIQGQKCYPDIESVPEVVDLVVIAVSADATLAQLERCHARGIPAALLYAASFSETNEPARGAAGGA